MAAKTSGRVEYHKWPRTRAKVTELFLDPENIRMEMHVQASQQSLINDLFVNENAMQILESIVINGHQGGRDQAPPEGSAVVSTRSRSRNRA